MTLKITGLVTEPVEIAETPVGRLFISRWNFGAIQKVMKAELSGASGADFLRGFLATSPREAIEALVAAAKAMADATRQLRPPDAPETAGKRAP